MTSLTANNPFVGLRPFESNEDFLFFGREEQSLELLQRLHQHHFVAVIGSSGSGKSSLIKAGLIPGLEAGYLVNNRDRWMIASMKPGQDPLYNLAASVLDQLKETSGIITATGLVEKIKEEGVDAILDIIKPLREGRTNFFLLVDQFEELFRFSLDQKSVERKDDATDFVNILLQLSEQKDLPVYVVITMRSDFIGDCTRFFGLPEAFNQSQYLVPRLNRTQLKTTIEGPVRLYKGKISPGLTARLLNDVQIVKDELPLLQHALMRTWEYELLIDKSGELDISDYENVGGIEKALSNHADEALVGMSDAELSLTKQIFQALTTVDENGRKVRRPARLSELEALTGAGKEQILLLINRFIEGNRSFLVINTSDDKNDWLIDISHESLIRQWGTLNGWVDEEAESAKMYDRLIESASLYKEKKKDLLTGSELQLAANWYKTYSPRSVWARRYNAGFEESIQYLKQSEVECEGAIRRKKTNRRKLLVSIVSITTILIIVLASALLNARSSARTARDQKIIADSSTKRAELALIHLIVEKEKVDSIAQIAIEQRMKADSSKLEAIAHAMSAEKAQSAAVKLKEAAERAHELALQHQEQTELQKEAFRLIIVARQKVGTDATLALRIAEEAMEKYPDSLIVIEANEIYQKNTFYKTVKDNLEGFSSCVFSPDRASFTLTELEKRSNGDYKSFWGDQYYLDGKEPLHFTYSNWNNFKKASISPDQSTVLIVTADSVLLMSMEGKEKGAFKDAHQFESGDFSPDGTRILTRSKNSAAVWTKDGKTLVNINDNAGIRFITSSPDNTKIVIGTADSTLKILDQTGKQLNSTGLSGVIESVTFSPDGKKMLAFLTDSSVTVCSMDDVTIKKTFGGKIYGGKIYTAVFSKDGSKILIGLSDNTARLANLNDTDIIELRGHSGTVTSLAFSPDDKKILTASKDRTARLWDTHGRLLKVLNGHTHEIVSATFSADGTKIFTSSLDRTVKVWDYLVNEFEGHDGEINLVAYSPLGSRILTGSEDRKAKLWDMNGEIATFIHNNSVASVAFSPDGKKILTGAGDTAILWSDANTPDMKFVHAAVIQSVAFAKDGTKIITGSDDSTARVWDLRDGTELEMFKHKNGVVAVTFSPDGTKVLTGSRDSTARLWRSNERGGQKPMGFKHAGIVYAVAFSPDNTMFLTGSEDSTAKLWRVKDGKELSRFKHNNVIESVAFSPDGLQVLTGSYDHTARLWTLEGKLLMSLNLPGPVRSVAFSPDGKKVFTGARDGIGRLFRAVPLNEFLHSNAIDTLTEDQKYQFIK